MGKRRLSISRLWQSAVVWTWWFTGLRLASGILLLPVLVHVLAEPEFGMYMIFLHLGSFLPLMDLGFSLSIWRNVSFAMGGATELKPVGVSGEAGTGQPNYPLLWRLLHSVRFLYRYLTVGAVVLLGGIGTYTVGLTVNQTQDPAYTWFAWGLALAAAGAELYTRWWVVFLRGLNRVVVSARIDVLAQSIKLTLACILLLGGVGLPSVPAAALVALLIQRQLARYFCLRELGSTSIPVTWAEVKSVLSILWPNSWRFGLQVASSYFTVNVAHMILCSRFFPEANSAYGLSLRIMNILESMSAVWTYVRWPRVGQLRAQHDQPALVHLLRPNVWLQKATFVAMAAGVILVGPDLLHWLDPEKDLISLPWLLVMTVNYFLLMQFSFWTTLLSTENRIPSLWPTIATNLVGLGLTLTFLTQTDLQIGALVLGPLIAGSLYNYWHWPLAGARSLKISWWRFLFTGQTR